MHGEGFEPEDIDQPAALDEEAHDAGEGGRKAGEQQADTAPGEAIEQEQSSRGEDDADGGADGHAAGRVAGAL